MSSFKTAPPQDVHPWKCVWRNGDGIRCHIGRIFDLELLEGGEEFIQTRFPRKKPITVTLIGGLSSNASGDANVSPGAQGDGVGTGGAKVYYKSVFGRVTASTAGLLEVPSGTGYAFWPEGLYRQRNDSTYVILKRETDDAGESKWILSLVGSSSVEETDIKIALRVSASLVQIWQSDIFYSAGAVEDSFPFKVTCNSDGEISVVTGAVHNIVCEFTPTTPAAGLWYVYVKASGWTGYNPSAASIILVNAVTADTDTEGHLLLGMVNIVSGTPKTCTVTQIAGGSQWVDRFKCGSDGTADYYWSRV